MLSLDVGLRKDRTVATVCHIEQGRVVVLDRIAVWSGSHDSPVLLQEVEAWVRQAAITYRCKVVCDPWQAAGLMQRLAAHGLAVEEFTFSASSVGRLAATLFNLIHDHDLHLPDDSELLDELAHVRLRETSPGTFRMDHDPSRHDDRAIALGMSAVTLLSGAQAPVNLSREIEAIKAGMAGQREPVLTEQLWAGQATTEELYGGARRGNWKSRLDPDLPTLR